MAGVLLSLVGLLPAAVAQHPVEDAPGSDALVGAAANLELRFGRKQGVRGESISSRLSPPVRAALNDWAASAERLGLAVAVGERAECVILGRCDKKLLAEAVGWADATWDELVDVRPVEPGWRDATLVFLFDREGAASEAWSGLFSELAARQCLSAQAATSMAGQTGSLMLRDMPAFIQTTWDTAGDAAAGDDEFRVANEVAHKLAQCLLHERFGPVPDTLRWGMGYVVEQRLFREIYQFDGSGFVAAESHVDWPEKAGKLLAAARKDTDFSIARLAAGGNGGQADAAQMLTWAALDYLVHEQPERLAELLGGLAGLHREALPFGSSPTYLGDDDTSAALLGEHLDSIDTKQLIKHIKRVK